VANVDALYAVADADALYAVASTDAPAPQYKRVDCYFLLISFCFPDVSTYGFAIELPPPPLRTCRKHK